MQTRQCGNCLRYMGALQCEAFPQGIPQVILLGEHDHTEALGSETKLYREIPEGMLKSLENEATALIEHVNEVVEKEEVGYARLKSILKTKGYTEEDFWPEGVFYGKTAAELAETLATLDQPIS